MRVLLLPLLVLFLLSTISAQMTFSDHWSKKNFPSKPSITEEKSDPNFCKDEAYYEMRLDWLRAEIHKTQRELMNCHLPRN